MSLFAGSLSFGVYGIICARAAGAVGSNHTGELTHGAVGVVPTTLTRMILLKVCVFHTVAAAYFDAVVLPCFTNKTSLPRSRRNSDGFVIFGANGCDTISGNA